MPGFRPAFFVSLKEVEKISFRLPKAERVCSQKVLDLLFQDRTLPAITQFPIRLVYTQIPLVDKAPFQVVFLVPKRHVKKAHERNQIKRWMRESYRHKKPFFHPVDGLSTAFLIIWLGKGKGSLEEIKKSMDILFESWVKSANGVAWPKRSI